MSLFPNVIICYFISTKAFTPFYYFPVSFQYAVDITYCQHIKVNIKIMWKTETKSVDINDYCEYHLASLQNQLASGKRVTVFFKSCTQEHTHTGAIALVSRFVDTSRPASRYRMSSLVHLQRKPTRWFHPSALYLDWSSTGRPRMLNMVLFPK
jgi:hypothetical protein